MRIKELRPNRETVGFSQSGLDTNDILIYTIGTAIDGDEEECIKKTGFSKVDAMYNIMVKKIESDLEGCEAEYIKMFGEHPNEYYFECYSNDIYKDINPKIKDGMYQIAKISVGVGMKNSTRKTFYTGEKY